MDLIYSHPKFMVKTPHGQETCKLEVYADEGRYHVTVMVCLPRSSAALQHGPHPLINALYREVLFRHLTPASSLKFYCVDSSGEPQHVQLEGLPGGYTGGQLMPCLSLPVAVRSMTA